MNRACLLAVFVLGCMWVSDAAAMYTRPFDQEAPEFAEFAMSGLGDVGDANKSAHAFKGVVLVSGSLRYQGRSMIWHVIYRWEDGSNWVLFEADEGLRFHIDEHKAQVRGIFIRGSILEKDGAHQVVLQLIDASCTGMLIARDECDLPKYGAKIADQLNTLPFFQNAIVEYVASDESADEEK